MSRHVILLPSLACQASCAYCFGPNRGPTMPPDVFDATVSWIVSISPIDEPLDITFHGGEPLLAGRKWYERNLPILRRRFGNRLKLHVQSNLWLLDDGYCALFEEYGVSLGTSLDGPEPINDRQRGEGYFAQTMAGIETARRHDLDVGVICTFTRLSAPHYREVLDFFIAEHLSFSVHAAVSALADSGARHFWPDFKGLDQSSAGSTPIPKPPRKCLAPRAVSGGDGLAMSPEEHAELFVRLFDAYVENVARVQISTFDEMARGISVGHGGICTFADCLGDYLTVGPRGGIYPCNRFAHHPEWRLGSVLELPDLEALSRSAAWEWLRERELAVHEDCGDCPHFDYCRGGCPYNAVAGGSDRRDPHCLAYWQVFDHITDRALEEVFSEENLDAVVTDGPVEHGLMRKGKLLQIMRGGPHPQKVARRAREVAAAVALAVSGSPDEALCKLDRAGLVTRPDLALQSLTALRRRLDTQSQQGLVNAYIHVTYACNLTCSHCYARSGQGESPAMAVDDVVRLVREAARAGFRKAVITGGEPLVHPQRDALLDALAALRQDVKPLRAVIRTNLAYRLTPALLDRLARSTDQVVVSLDGDEASHDARRGAGTYARTVANLRALLAARSQTSKVSQTLEVCPTEVGITAVLTAEQTGGPEGDAVRALGEELGVRVRFKSVLPLGRGADLELTSAFYSSLDEGAEAIAYGARPAATCGLGMNLYVGPGGECFPCYALMGARHDLGNALEDGLAAVLERNDAYRGVTVDSNRRCRRCALRYLCGGFCRAWSTSDDPDAPPTDCTALYRRAWDLLLGALDVLDVSVERWLAAGLPCPEPDEGPLPDPPPGVKWDYVDCLSQNRRKESCHSLGHPTLRS